MGHGILFRVYLLDNDALSNPQQPGGLYMRSSYAHRNTQELTHTILHIAS